MSGEDPVLGSTLVGPLVTGIQKNVMSIGKHYIGNTQEATQTSTHTPTLTPWDLIPPAGDPPSRGQ